mmetsp:Transcript_21468/g.29835  ORF Transcript_21468/g.29835 Transcript_21468/m.29835 type:complete len:303 (+) Transcript_21468:98-1006(+)
MTYSQLASKFSTKECIFHPKNECLRTRGSVLLSPRSSPLHHSSIRFIIANHTCRSLSISIVASNAAAEVSANAEVVSDVASACPRKRLSVWVSGGGSNFKALYRATQDGRINGDITMVVSDKPGCGGWEFAREVGIPTLHFPPKKGQEGLSAGDVVALLKEAQVDYVLLAGFLKLVPSEVVSAFPRAVLNIHPALLPAFGGKGYYGHHVHQAVVDSGARVSGPTIHFVDEEYDKGKIVAQRAVPVYPTDGPEDVARRVLEQEHKLFPEVVGMLCNESYEWREDSVIMFKQADQENEGSSRYI